MSRLFGPATQNGIVVADLDAALAYWTGSLGAGPFFRTNNLPNEYFFQRGRELPPPEMSIAIGNWGDLQIELICPHGDGESTWHQFLKTTGGGLHHISVWSPTYDAHVQQAREAGLEMECHGKVRNGPRYSYFYADAPGQPLLEIADYTPALAALFGHVRDAARNWDGADPVRST
ncbi:VOC family protein [Polymorphobacter arshaanensis]|uniref:VOC family protein n=1 Tax=Glacieibacterium arshaanense TaxID=2511025 RepID=A0A4Y9EPE3_9SPHN|nr:VOC family protein [Polymorphobacter arshaanensis]TFU05495.1 VOC family protein [Polymorphobacter arshaanensis]